MGPITEYANCYSVAYRKTGEGRGRRREFPFALSYLNGVVVNFSLVARQRSNGTWRVEEALIEKSGSLPEVLVRDVLADFAALRWYVFPAEQRGRVLPPVVAVWERGDYLAAACLAPEYGGKALPLAEQERWFSGESGAPPDPERLLCWWPDPVAWKALEEVMVEAVRAAPATRSFALPFYTYSEWFARPDVGDVPDRALEYARYLRRFRTNLLFFRTNGWEPVVTLGNVKRAQDFFVRRKLDDRDPSSWALVATEFDAMPEFLLEVKDPCGPSGALVSGRRVRAAVGYYSHFPDTASSLDCVGAALYAGSAHLCDVVLWLNPLAPVAGEGVLDRAVDGLWREFSHRGVKEVASIDGVLPFEACPQCGGMALQAPDAWLRCAPVRSEKVGRNDPCPCGSSLKYKKCCGRVVR